MLVTCFDFRQVNVYLYKLLTIKKESIKLCGNVVVVVAAAAAAVVVVD